MNKNSILVVKNTCWILFVKPWPLQQSPVTKLLKSVVSFRDQNLTCNFSFHELQFAGNGRDLTNFAVCDGHNLPPSDGKGFTNLPKNVWD